MALRVQGDLSQDLLLRGFRLVRLLCVLVPGLQLETNEMCKTKQDLRLAPLALFDIYNVISY